MPKSEVKIGAVLSYVIIFLNTLIGLFYTPFLTGMLGQSEFGLYSLVNSIISYMTVLDFGFGNAITVYTSKYLASNDKKGMAKLNGMFLIIYTIIGVIAAIIGLVLSTQVETLFGQTMSADEISTAKILMYILTFNLVITFPFSLFSNVITAHEKFIFSKCINIIRVVAQPILMTPMLIFGYKSITLVTIITMINIICLLANTIFAFKKLNIKFIFLDFNKNLLIEIFSYSFFIFLNQIVDKVNWGVDNFILGAICGTTTVAVYSVALQFNNMYLSFSTAISSVLLPKVSKMEAKNATNKDFTNIFIYTGRIQFFILALIITGFILFGKQFILYLFGHDYEDAYIIACILMVPVTIPLIQNTGINILQAKNKVKFRSILYIFIAIGNIIISIFLSKYYGGIGAALGTSIAFIIGNFLIMNVYYHKVIKLNIWKFWKEILIIAFPIIIVFIPALLIVNFTKCNGIIFFIAEIIIYTILYCLLLWFFALNNTEKILLLNPIKRFFKHR